MARARVRGSSMLVLVAIMSCRHVHDESERVGSTEQAVTDTCRDATLDASVSYVRPTSWNDATASFSPSFAFAIPSALPVVAGNSGNKEAVLTIEDAPAHSYKCRYRGGSSAPHPTEVQDIAAGQQYVFSYCDSHAHAGDVVTATKLTLHVINGDDKNPAQKTEVRLVLHETGACSGADAGSDAELEASDAETEVGVDSGPEVGSDAPEDAPEDAATCSTAACDDHNPCTTDRCNTDGTCTNAPVADGTSCSDQNSCNGMETCAAGTCVAGTPVSCAAADMCHAAGVCDPQTGTCSSTPLPDGTTCDDGNACTQLDACTSGACTGSNSVQCTAIDACHAAGVCDPANGACSRPILPDNTACDDNNGCTQIDTCQAGTCTGSSPVQCAAADGCHSVGTCDPATGMCSNPTLPDGTSCSDLDACNGNEVCSGGACISGPSPSCTSPSLCLVAGCDPSSGCTLTPALEGTSCSDANRCNGDETCDGAGTCRSGTPPSCTSTNPCLIAACDPVNGCSLTPAAAGTSCSDQNACNGTETCDGAGSCVAGPAPSCATGNPCVVDACDPAIGCTSTPVPVGTSCSNGDACDGAEMCDGAGSCAPGTPLSCTTDNACVVASCEPTTGCVTTPKPAGTSCADATLCNGDEICDGSGACSAGTPLSCNSNNLCVVDACNPGTGCTHTPIPNCNPTPVQGDAPFETRASILGRLVGNDGSAITGATFTVYDERASGMPRVDVQASTASDGGFRIRLTAFPDVEPARAPPHRLVVDIDAPEKLRATRVLHAHVGDAVDLGTIRLIGRDPKVTLVGPSGGVASDSRGLVEVVIPAGALGTTIPVQITPFTSREDFPAPLPPSSITMYGFELEPSGTTFSVPATLRIANYRDLPTTLSIPLGSYDDIEGRWVHEGLGAWDGSRFAAPVRHFSKYDLNGVAASDLLLIASRTKADLNRDRAQCGKGSSWRPHGGSVAQAIGLPSTRAAGGDLGLSLHYDSGLAGSRKLGAASVGPSGAVARGALAVSTKSTTRTECVPHGSAGPLNLRPGECVSVVGSCGTGGSGMAVNLDLLGAQYRQLKQTAENASEWDDGEWIDLPLGSTGQLPGTGFVPASLSVLPSAAGATNVCAVNGGKFGVADETGFNRTLLSTTDPAPLMQARRRVFVHHRFTSPFGSGWALGEIERLFVTGDNAILVDGDGQEETFLPRARLRPMPNGSEVLAFSRDRTTGEILAAAAPGTIEHVDPTTGERTPIVSGLAFPGTYPEVLGLAVAYVGGTRHFVVALTDELLDVDTSGAQRVLTTRTPFGGLSEAIEHQASVEAVGDTVYYTSGLDDPPVLYRAFLSAASPALVPISSVAGDVTLYPKGALSSVQFSSPRGLALAPDGTLYLADQPRHVVYAIRPDASGVVGPASAVEVVLGDGQGQSAGQPGERQPAEVFSIHSPLRLGMSEDGMLLVQTTYGMASYDPLAKEAEFLFLDGGRDEIVPSLAGYFSTRPSSFVALTSTSLLSRSTEGLVRAEVDLLSSDGDPTRTIARLPAGGFELTDTARAVIERFDSAGRLVEQRRRTGETDFTIAYSDDRGDRPIAITNGAGGQWVLSYANDKIAAITDPAGGTTTFTVDAQGDLLSFAKPDGEQHAFTYDEHHMTSKTGPRGDVTAYTYAPDGTLATSAKPGGESYSFTTVDTGPSQPTYDAQGRLVHTGSFTDARGLVHDFVTDGLGRMAKETVTADGVTRTRQLVYAASPLYGLSAGEAYESRRTNNRMLRVVNETLNGVTLGPERVELDSLGRPTLQSRLGAGSSNILGLWTYTPDGWLATEHRGEPSYATQHFQRDAAGHVLRIFDTDDGTNAPTGREETFTWRADGQLSTLTAHGITTSFEYDDAGGSRNLLRTSDTLGRTLTLGYDARGNVSAVNDGAASAAFVFDANNRLVVARDGFGNETLLGYQTASCGCGEEDEVTSVHTPDLPAGVSWAMTYGAQGRLATVTDPHGFTEAYDYEPTGELKAVRDRLGRTTAMTHDQLGRVLSIVDTLGRKHQRAYPVPQAGSWVGPALTAASADATPAATSLSTALRSGDYQIGLNAFDVEGYPAQISVYRDATFALGYTHYFDGAKRLTRRVDRTAEAIDSAAVPAVADPGTVSHEQYAYDLRSSEPLLQMVASPLVPGGGNASSILARNVEHDVTSATGYGVGLEAPAAYTYTRDTGGRVTRQTNRFTTFDAGTSVVLSSYDTTYSYLPNGRLASIASADGASVTYDTRSGALSMGLGPHAFTYDARGQLATQTAFDGTYIYTYDELGRNKRLEFPDGHARVQVFDDVGRITSRCYVYGGNPSLDRCYGAQYDAVGNPVRLTDPEGADVAEYDGLDRLTKVTRFAPDGVTQLGVESYAYNGLGAQSVSAGVVMDHQRPRLDGAGLADAAIPATLGGSPVALDAGGRVTSLRGTPFVWGGNGALRSAGGVPIGIDTFGRRVWTGSDFFVHEGADRVAVVESSSVMRPGHVKASFLYDGVDHPLRLASSDVRQLPGQPDVYEQAPSVVGYYEVDLAGNVRRLRGYGGADLGGYRYTAFGKTVEDTSTVQQALRWKGRPRDVIGGVEIYDMRARWWVPEMGAFLSVDEYEFHNASSTFWGWPGQNPLAFSDPSGRDGTTDNPIQRLVDANLLPPGLTIFAKGVRMRSSGLSMMANDATFEQGMAKYNCGNSLVAAGANITGTDATVIAGAADLAVNAARAVETAALPHGNSLTSPRAQHVYEILRTNAAGDTEVYKFGISSGPIRSSGLSARAEAQVTELNAAASGAFRYESDIVAEIPAGPGARQEALAVERSLVYQYRNLTGAKPVGNIRP